MNNKTNLLTAVIMAGVGVALIVLHDRVEILQWISIMFGIMFIIPSIFTLGAMIYGRHRSDEEKRTNSGVATAGTIAAIGGLGLGLAMCIVPDVFASIFAYVFAGVLIIAGIYHVSIVGYMSRTISLPGYFYVIPALLIVTGLVIIFTSLKTLNNVVVLVTGIALIMSAVNSIMEFIGSKKKPKNLLEEHVDESVEQNETVEE